MVSNMSKFCRIFNSVSAIEKTICTVQYRSFNTLHDKKDKRVAVIGTGVSGICALRNLTDPPEGIIPVAFERASWFGGHWGPSEQVTVDRNGYPPPSAIYQGLRTNLPKQLMELPGLTYNEDLPTFPTQNDVYKYIRTYVDKFDLQKYIKSNTLITDVSPCASWDRNTKWKVTYSDVNNSKNRTTEYFDAVLVCNGNCVFPNIPSISNLDKFKGRVVHSRDYRYANDFKGQKVAVLGASFSAKDIARQLSDYASDIYLTHIDPPVTTVFPHGNVTEKNTWIKTMTDKSMILQTGEEVELDAIVMCTGFKFYYPFLSEDVLEVKDDHCSSLYKHIVHAKYPNLHFITVWRNIALFPIAFHLAKFSRAILDGTAKLPPTQEMMAEIKADTDWRMKNNLEGRLFHYMDDLQWTCADEIADLGKIEKLPRHFPAFWDFIGKHRDLDFINYYKYDYIVRNNEIVDVVKRPEFKLDNEAHDPCILPFLETLSFA